MIALNDGDVILALQVEPKRRAVAKVASEAHRGVGADRAPGIEDVGDPAGWHADIERQAVGRELAPCGPALRALPALQR